MPTRSVELTEHFEQFINASVSSGRFGDANEIVGEGLRLLEEREREDAAKLEWLRTAAKEAFDSLDRGEGIAFESMDDLSAFLDKIGEEALEEVATERRAESKAFCCSSHTYSSRNRGHSGDSALERGEVRQAGFPSIPGPHRAGTTRS